MLLDARPDVHVLGLDRDADAVEAARSRLARFGDRAKVVHGGFERLGRLVERHGEGEKVMGILMDLGVSSAQLDRPERGFSYRFDAPLDMRMDAKQSLTATEVVNGYEESQLAAVISQYGEERFARRIAHAIVARPARCARRASSPTSCATRSRPRPAAAARTRRAARSRRSAWKSTASSRTSPTVSTSRCTSSVRGGRVLVLAYHSLEDRMVKETFGRWAGDDADARRPGQAARARRRGRTRWCAS